MKIDLPYLARFDDSEEQTEWTPRLNDFIRESILALQQVQEDREFHDITFLGGSSNVDVSTRYMSEPGAVLITQCRDRSTGAVVATPVQCVWSFVAGSVRIESIPSLVAGTSYDLRLCIYGRR